MNVLSLLIIVLIGANYFGPFADLDFAWQVRTGERIVKTGTLQPPEAFTYTIEGAQVPDFEWLYEVILWLVWDHFGFGGLKFLRVVLVATPLLLLARRLHREGIRWHGIALALVAAVFVLTPAWNLRPLFCTTIGLLLVSGCLHDHCIGRQQLSWWLPVIMLLWANLHPGVIAGQGLLLGAVDWEWLNRWVKLNPPLGKEALRRLSLIGGLALLATLVAPHPFQRLLYPFQPGLRHPIQRIFVEMQPLYTFLGKPPYAIALVYVIAALVLLSIVWRFRQYRLWEVALLAGLAVLANLAFRSLQDWFLVMLALGVPHLRDMLVQAAHASRRRGWVRILLRLDRSAKRTFASPLLRFQPFGPALAVCALLVVSLIPPLARQMPIQNAEEWPVEAVAYIEDSGLKGRFFSPPDFGSFLIWRLPTQARSYTDTRGFFFPPILIEDSHYIPLLGQDWRLRLNRVLDQYRTDYFLLETDGARGAFWQGLRAHLGQPLFQNEKTVLLSAEQVRRGIQQMEPRPPDPAQGQASPADKNPVHRRL